MNALLPAREFREWVKFDENLRKIGFPSVYGLWNEDCPYFSIGEGRNNICVYVGKIPVKDGKCKEIKNLRSHILRMNQVTMKKYIF